jgi:hypothetical protein
MLRHSLMNENARALPVGALATFDTYALRILNSTALTRSTVSPERSSVVFTAAYRAASLDLRLTRVAILQNSPTHFHARYLSTLLGLNRNSKFHFFSSFGPRLEQAKPTEASKARPDFDPLN